MGGINLLSYLLSEYCKEINVEFDNYPVANNITIPIISDYETHLIIRSSYDTNAIVDNDYCKDKVNFCNLIKDQSFSLGIAYFNEVNELVNNITMIPDNGNHPNFILKPKQPYYDKNEYPKLYKVTNEAELDVILQNVNKDYFLMTYYCNTTKLCKEHLYVIRSFNLLIPPN